MERKDTYRKLASRFAENKASEEEQALFFELLKQGEIDEVLSEQMDEDIMKAGEPKKAPVRFINYARIAAAAVLIVAAGVVFQLVRHAGEEPAPAQETVVTKYGNDIAPGGNKAILTLADGSSITLDSAQKGVIAAQQRTKVVKLADGQLAYEPEAGAGTAAVQYNTLSTPKGGQYQLTLADGTKVWLNAASSIRFPSRFEGADRSVDIAGEVYFEVAKNPAKPFKVAVNGSVVQVLGTHFNINAYTDNASTDVTLLEGLVNVAKDKKRMLLRPGQQAQVEAEAIKLDAHPNLDQVMAWKNGRFFFDGVDIRTLMKQLEKWYDIEVVYKTEPKYSFVAKIRRDVNISEVLQIMENTELVHFKVDGRVVTVLP